MHSEALRFVRIRSRKTKNNYKIHSKQKFIEINGITINLALFLLTFSLYFIRLLLTKVQRSKTNRQTDCCV
jgi:hypothetical protein